MELSVCFISLPFMEPTILRGAYNASDIGAWPVKSTATIQEAIGTGLYILLSREEMASHLLPASERGAYFTHGDPRELAMKAEAAAGTLLERQRRERCARDNSGVSYARLGEGLLR